MRLLCVATGLSILLFTLGCSTGQLRPLTEPDKARESRIRTSVGQTIRVRIESFDLQDVPPIGKTGRNEVVYLGGFSGLISLGPSLVPDSVDLMTHTDRGPNTDIHKFRGTLESVRPFVLPEFQPRMVVLRLDRKTYTAKVENQFLLRTLDRKITGVPNLPQVKGASVYDETPSDLIGQKLKHDPYGVDTEGLDQDGQGNVWMVEEYRPSILKVSKNGVVLKRFVPKGRHPQLKDVGTPLLPRVYETRIPNGGFEAAAVSGSKLYAFMQMPLDNPKRKTDFVRVLEFDILSEQLTGEYLYPIDFANGLKIGDATSLGGKKFLVVEHDGRAGAKTKKAIYEMDLTDATNTLNLKENSRLEEFSLENLEFQRIQLVKKSLYYDLVELGLQDYAKMEGLAKVDDSTLALVYDNDFNVSAGFDEITGKLKSTGKPKLKIILIQRLSGK